MEYGKPFQTPQRTTITCGPKCAYALSRRGVILWWENNPPTDKKWPTKADKNRHYRLLRRTIYKDTQTEVFAATEIYERDGWRCRICGKKVNQTLNWPHPKSASLDHIVPLSEGGGHVRANVQCAHLSCNSRKGVKRVGDQLLLIG